ncbi:hypothetical protein GGD50_003547 [Rhizobium paranaense]|uniref:Uncharacterized protein n=1 Tax=Rhizobium paranaense TaxID=1650438 RepID=A0A7W8XSS1_9HYPH|nr:hypothetical protein [Rhizobium paranaense]
MKCIAVPPNAHPHPGIPEQALPAPRLTPALGEIWLADIRSKCFASMLKSS